MFDMKYSAVKYELQTTPCEKNKVISIKLNFYLLEREEEN